MKDLFKQDLDKPDMAELIATLKQKLADLDNRLQKVEAWAEGNRPVLERLDALKDARWRLMGND